MWNAANYRPDPLITAGSDWARRKGIPNHAVSVRRISDHVHVLNCMNDMNNLAAVVAPGTSYVAQVTETRRCETCQPVIYTMSYLHRSGKPGSNCTRDRAHLDQMARNAMRLSLTNIEVRDDTGRDVTFEIPAFCETIG